MRLENFIKKQQPVLLGVDGGADGLAFLNYIPDIIFGDMDSVSDESLKKPKILYYIVTTMVSVLERRV